MTIRSLFFDLDGTLIDTAPDFHWVVNELLARHQRPPLSYERIRQTVSNGARALVTLAFGIEEGHDEFPALRDELLELYTKHLAENSRLFSGISELLEACEAQGVLWGVVTNKPERFTTPLLQALQLADRCASVVCPDHVTNTKPDPEPLLLACRHCDTLPEQSIYVGDHARDIEAGRRAGMRTVAAGYGYINPDENIRAWRADHYVDDAAEIIAILQNL